mmetsp:Transcript_3674/g.7958  ORF Transcript_3674/g.7958 Transcript_3674/m.7958 type:complete len:84 (+) Transcript_3674:103-354(+)
MRLNHTDPPSCTPRASATISAELLRTLCARSARMLAAIGMEAPTAEEEESWLAAGFTAVPHSALDLHKALANINFRPLSSFCP